MAATFMFGHWTASTDALTLTSPGRFVRIEPKAMTLLECLARHSPDVVSRETLLEEVWPGVVVGDNAVHRIIRLLRRALQDDAKAPVYIESIPRRGYRLLVPATFQEGARSERLNSQQLGYISVLVAEPRVTSIPESHNRLCALIARYLGWSDGALKVYRAEPPPEHPLNYRIEIGMEPTSGKTAVDWEILEGESRELVCAARHEEPNPKISFDHIAELVADAVLRELRRHRRATIDGAGDLTDLPYWDLIWLSDHYRSMEKTHVATRSVALRKAITAFPLQAPAHAALADLASWEIANGLAETIKESKTVVLDEAATALEIDNQHSYVLRKCGSAYSRIGEHARGVSLCRRAFALAPSTATKDLLALALSYAGEAEEATALFNEILASLPSGHTYNSGRVVVALVQQGLFEDALPYSDSSITYFPKDYFCWTLRSNLLAQLGRIQEAQYALKQAMRLMPGLSLPTLIAGIRRTYGRTPAQQANLTAGLEQLEGKG